MDIQHLFLVQKEDEKKKKKEIKKEYIKLHICKGKLLMIKI